MTKLISTTYSKNILTLISGNSLAQAIPIIVSPILTRLYTPSDFGVLALFSSIIVLLSSIASGQYESSIMLTKKEKDAYLIGGFAILISLSFSFITFFIILLFHTSILNYLNNNEIGTWLYIIPFITFLTTIFNVLNFLNLKLKNFKGIASVKVYKSLGLSIIQVSVGILKDGAFGLILGQVVSHFLGIFYLLKNINPFKYKFSFSRIIILAKKYKKFPIYYLPNNLIFNSFNTINNILISSFFSISNLGFYSFANKILGIPSSVIGSAISQAYLEKASSDVKKNLSIMNTFLLTLKKLVIISFPIFLFCFFSMELIFEFVFGKNWVIAGYYAQILSPLFFIRFVSAGLNTTTVVLEKQQLELYFNIFIMIFLISIYIISNILSLKFEYFLMTLTIVLTIIYIFKIYYYYNLIKKVKNEKDINNIK